MQRPVPFVDVEAQMRVHALALEAALSEVIRSGKFIGGPKVEELERRLAAVVGVEHAVACGSGTDAEELLLLALGIGPGDEVLVPAFTFMATAEAVALVGATPVCVDVDPHTFTMSADAVRAALGPKVVAMVPVSLFGQPAPLDELELIAQEHGLVLIEDACQSFGARLHGRPSGSFGRAGFTSFYPSKPLGGLGDGGMIFTGDSELAARLRSLREHGLAGQHLHLHIGINSRLDALQAAALLVKLDSFEQEVGLRRQAAQRYDQALGGAVLTPRILAGRYCSYAQYTVRAPHGHRDRLVSHLASRGIPTAIHYPRPLHAQPSLQSVIRRRPPTPVVEELCASVVSLPLSAQMAPQDQERVISGVLSWSKLARATAGA